MPDLDPLNFKVRFITVPEGARIYIDGRDTGKVTPALIENLTDGIHSYKLLLDGYQYAEGTFNPCGWRGFTAQVNHMFTKREEPRVYRQVILKFKNKNSKKYDALNPLTWKSCPDCGVKVSEAPFRYRKHEVQCRNCNAVFRIPGANVQKVPADPWKDPESLICSEKLDEITGKEPAAGNEGGGY